MKSNQQNLNEEGFFDEEFLTSMYGNNWAKFHFENSSGLFIYTPVLHKINGTDYYYSDAWRGYYEPYTSTYKATFLHSALLAYSEWCKSNNIICELMRLEPESKISSILVNKGKYQIISGQPVAAIEVPESYDIYFKILPNSCRRNIIKAQQKYWVSNLTQDSFLEIHEIYKIHYLTMTRCKAASKWYIPLNNFKSLLLKNKMQFIVIRNNTDNAIVSFSGIITHRKTCQILLIGNLNKEENVGACDLLYTSVVKYCINQNKNLENTINKISFGGGRSFSIDEPLMKFKLKFSNKEWGSHLNRVNSWGKFMDLK